MASDKGSLIGMVLAVTYHQPNFIASPGADSLMLPSDWVRGKNRETYRLALHPTSQTGTNPILMETWH